MTTQPKPVTKSQVLKLARKRHGRAAGIEECKGAPTSDEREWRRRKLAELIAEAKEIDAKLAGRSWSAELKSIISATEFVCDVNGDSPSITQLSEALAHVKEFVSLSERKEEIIAERRSGALSTHVQRWRIYVDGGMFRHIREQADTLDELAEKLTKGTT